MGGTTIKDVNSSFRFVRLSPCCTSTNH